MSLWDTINQALNSNPFKAMFPVQALAQGATKMVTGMDPAQQYATGGIGGAGIAGMGALMGSGAGAGMTPYMPTSTPSMDMAGSTLGPGGMFSPLNPMGASAPETAGPSALMKALSAMRGLPQGGGGGQQQQPAQQRQQQEQLMRTLYAMFPELQPGAKTGRIGTQGGQPWRL